MDRGLAIQHRGAVAPFCLVPARVGPTVARVRAAAGECELGAIGRARVEAYRAAGVVVDDAPLAALRRRATNLAAFVGDDVVAAISLWRLSEAGCSLASRLAAVQLERYASERVVEVGSLFVVPQYRGRGLARQVLAHAYVSVVAMQPELLVAFAAAESAERYARQFGFEPVGPAAPHPFSPTLRVLPLAVTLDRMLARSSERLGVEDMP